MGNNGGQYRLLVSFFSETGPARKENEDNYFVNGGFSQYSENSAGGDMRLNSAGVKLLAVYDGMGGETAGEKASLAAAAGAGTLLASLTPGFSEEELGIQLGKYYGQYMKAVQEYTENGTEICGTTCAAVLIDGNRLYPFWLGDSRVYVFAGGRLKLLTRDHTAAQERIDMGLLTEEKARASRSWHILTSYFGEADGEFSVGSPICLLPGDKILLCSDGLTDMYRDRELEQIVSQEQKEAMEVFQTAAKEQAEDNCTVILAEVFQIPETGKENQWEDS